MNPDDTGMVDFLQGTEESGANPEQGGQAKDEEIKETEAKGAMAKGVLNPHEAAAVSFDQLSPASGGAPTSKIDLVLDLPLQVTVELGRTNMLIRDILDLGPGSVIELDRIAGEPVDVLANGKLIAKGEVVVVDESFGVRIVDIVAPGERISQK
ncbi:MAG TPA: flagellar motor switch protein FliN [Firmicutes bacterium]|nr:flagellar motor switch protein FliN [Bacillota bacterium]